MDGSTENSPLGIALPAMEILEHVDLNAADARAITDKIRGSMGDLMLLVARAWIGRVWLALGYESWADYIQGEFDRAPLYLPRDERKAVVALLRGQGMSQRPIADAVGVSQKTVDRDLDELSHDDSVVLPDKVIGLDNKERPAHPAKPDVPRPPKPDVPEPQPGNRDDMPDWTKPPVDQQHDGESAEPENRFEMNKATLWAADDLLKWMFTEASETGEATVSYEEVQTLCIALTVACCFPEHTYVLFKGDKR
jgi:hypothetical protein